MKSTAFGKTYLPIVGFPISGKHKKKDFAFLDLSPSNKKLAKANIRDVETLDQFINSEIADRGAKMGIGGYGEKRDLYKKFKHFGDDGTNRTIHLGIDIWADHKTPIHAVLPGVVHGVANNDNPGDYGPTIIIKHMVANETFYSLYGHLSKKTLKQIKVGQIVKRGDRIATLGKEKENGGWPPHLHFQIVKKLDGSTSDYPGVCTKKDAPRYLENCPNPLELFSHSWDFIP